MTKANTNRLTYQHNLLVSGVPERASGPKSQDFLSAELSQRLYRHPDELVEFAREDEIWVGRVAKATALP